MSEYTSLQGTAYNYVRSKVLKGEIQPDTLYSETKMAAEIGISRTPMKDALVRLSQDKFIDIIPSKGFRLHKMSREDIWSTYQARTAVEGFCAMQLAAQRDTPEGQAAIAAMKRHLAEMEQFLSGETLEDGFFSTLLEQDVCFHQALVDFCRNEELMQLFRTYHYRLYFFALESLRVEGRPREAYLEHKAILDGIMDPGDSVGIRAYMKILYHMEVTKDIMLSIILPADE